MWSQKTCSADKRNKHFISLVGHPLTLSFPAFLKIICEKVQKEQLCSTQAQIVPSPYLHIRCILKEPILLLNYL